MRPTLAALVCLLATAANAEPLDLSRFELVDLSHSYNSETVYWPTSTSRFQLTRDHSGQTDGGWFYASNSICTPEHGGTHLDAPIHFGEGKQTTEAIPLERLVAAAVVIDVSDRADADADYLLSLVDVQSFEREHGEIEPGSIILLRTGWSRRWPDRKAYLGDDTPGDASRLHFPSFGEEAARFLVHERGAGALGVDTASIDGGQSKDFRVHRIAAGADVPGMENLTELSRLPARGAVLIALPMKIEGGSGGPLRAVALIPR